MSVSLAPQVSDCLEELRRAFPENPLEHRPDEQGGAWTLVHDLPLGPAFVPDTSWVAFPISSLYPRAHVYPHYVRADLTRTDGAALSVPLHQGQTVPVFAVPAVMVSRSSPRWDPTRDTAALKLHRVLLWFFQQAAAATVAA